MTIKIVKVLVTTVALGALFLGTDPSMARWPWWRRWRSWRGWRHFGGGGAHFSGAHFGGGHFSAARFSGARMGMSRFSAAHISGRNFSRVSRGNFAHVNAAHVHGLGAGALGSRAAWNHGAWNHGPLGTTGETIGGAAGTVDAAAAGGSEDQSSGPSLPAIFWPLRSGRGAITTRSGRTEICSCGMPCSGPVPSSPTGHMMTSMVGMHRAARHERAPSVALPPKQNQAPYPTVRI